MAWRKWRFGVGKFSAAEMPQAHGVVAAAIERIAAKGFTPIGCRTACGMAILLQVQTGDEEFFDGGHFGGRGRFIGGRWNGSIAARIGFVGDDLLP